MSLKMTLGRRSGEGWPYAATIDKAVEFGITHVEMDVDEVSDSFFYLEICMILQSLLEIRHQMAMSIFPLSLSFPVEILSEKQMATE